MYCPKCRSEYREGFTHCQQCDVDLVKALPQGAVAAKVERRTLSKILECQIEQWLKKGAIVYILIGIFAAVVTFCQKTFYVDEAVFGSISIVANGVTMLSSLISSILLGLVYFGFGKIIEILREGLRK